MNPDPEEIPPAPAPPTKLPLAPYLIPPAILLFIAELILRKLAGRREDLGPVTQPSSLDPSAAR